MAGVYINISNAPENNGWNDHLHLFLGQMEPEARGSKVSSSRHSIVAVGEKLEGKNLRTLRNNWGHLERGSCLANEHSYIIMQIIQIK